MESPDNHLSCRPPVRRCSQGYAPADATLWPWVLLAIVAWGIVLVALVATMLPLLQWAMGTTP